MTVEQMKFNLSKIASAQTPSEKASLCRDLLEAAIDYIYDKTGSRKPRNASLLELIDGIVVTSYIHDTDIVNALHYVRIVGMNAKHGRNIRKKEARLALDNITCLIELLASKETGLKSAYYKPSYMSEADTRKLYVDLYLREAGWDILDEENIVQPGKAGIEIEVQGMPNPKGIGYCDYVLYGRDGNPLAIVEVKKTSVDPEKGRHQVDLYAECMKKVYGYKPVLYYTNGYSMKIIDGIYPDRNVIAFHTIDDLELMLQRRKRGAIVDFTINNEITNRPYQKTAITNICEWLNAKHRRGLLVMATGTGKTRVAISLVDILSRNNWVKNVLFLADRTSLVNQAKRNFAKLMPNMSVCELSASGEKDYNARLMFCTYQTMINYIDAEDKRFSTGRFDLIIIDEAHRSIFNRYGTIFKYFDSFLIGLTATPKNEVDANTYRIFGCEAGIPNFDYTLEDAIKEHYLVGYRVRNRTSKIMSQGIDFAGLTDEQKEQLDEYLAEDDPPTPDFNIPGNEIFRYLFNKDTCQRVLEELWQWGIRVDGGETMGKTIIFAYNHRHAQMIVDCFRELYPGFPANTCQLVDYSVNYRDDLVIKFEEDDEFRIAVSVDMLDTGVDIPAILNLVFFKKVRSKIKFVQMIGRGTRLCNDLHGEGKDKKEFLIFDYCGNFEYFGLHPEGKAGKETLTLSQKLFLVKLDILHELQQSKYQKDGWFSAYYDQTKKELHNTVIKIKSHDNRIQVREAMRYVDKYCDLDTWVTLSSDMVKEVKVHLSPLLDSGLDGNYLAIAFDVRMFSIERALLKSEVSTAANHIKTVRLIAQYLLHEKASVPQVRLKIPELETIKNDAFWKAPTVLQIEEKRKSLRDLMQFLKGSEQKQFDIDIDDIIEDGEYQPDDTVIDIRTYREKVIDYLARNSDSNIIKKIHNLEPINNNDLQELERILWHELGTQQDYMATTHVSNLAVFVRSLIGLNQDAVNEKFSEYLSGNLLNSQQQEFIRMLINYVRENGDIELSDIVNTEPFSSYDLNGIFGINLPIIKSVVSMLHEPVIAET